MQKKLIGLATVLALSFPMQSMATVVQVKALENSTTGGVGVAVPLSFTVGDSFTVSVNPLDLWNAGALPRWSNADGLTGSNLLATGAVDTNGDDPGVVAGTVIGPGSFGNWSQGGLVAPYGTLVGQWDGIGSFFAIGTNFTGVAAGSALTLFYFDSFAPDNTGSILADVNTLASAVPEPETYGMLLVGLGMIGFMARRRKNNQA